jgi:ABC-type multidrug transport system fused ATPase/permease subunit
MEVVRNIREVKSFAAETKETARYRSRLSNTQALSSEAGRNRGVMESCSRFAIYFSIFSVSTLGGFLVQKGEMGAAALVAFIGYCFSLNFAIQGINYSWADLKRGTTLLDHVMSVLETPPTRPSLPSSLSTASDNKEEAVAVKGQVEFKDVVFAYPNRADVPVLR